MGIFDKFRNWKDERRTKKIMKKGSEIEKLTVLQMDALKNRAVARKARNSEEAMKYQKIAKDYELQIANLK